MASRLTEQRPPTPTPATVPTVEQAIPSFAQLGVPKILCDTLDGQGITAPFPIQVATLPDSLAGNDVLGRGRTGSGKTLAFSLPLVAQLMKRKIERTSRRPRALVLAPTRELALQISDTLKPLAAAAGLRTMVIIGGVNQNPQVNSLRQGVEIVVACPGRLEDLINQRHLSLEQVEVTVLDEADHMADLGFLPAVKRILDATPRDCQRMLFSATLDNGIDVIVKRYLTDPVTHSVDSEQSPVATMEHHVLHVTNDDRLPVLVDLTSAPGRTMVFTRTKQRAKQLTRALNAKGVSTVEMHGNLSQGARVKPLPPVIQGGLTLMRSDDFTVTLSWLQIAIVVLTLALMGGFTWIITRTPLGRAQRATEQDMKMAALLGINVDRIVSATFIMGAALAAVAGLMVTLYYGVIDFYIGFLAGIKAFTAAVLGGIGSLPGAMLGGLAIGLIEAFWSGYFSIAYKDVATFGILVMVLLFRPTGLLGRPDVEKI